TASLLGASFEAFVLDDEMHSNTYRALRGVEVTDENLGFDAICDAVLGDGHFLGGQHTHVAMERDYFYPTLADRAEPRTWAENGAQDAWGRARARADEILRDHKPSYLTPEQEEAIRSRFNILI
ncbi:MAG: trimethylamine methyltransferase family protein, partial [Ruegeria sp.]